MIITKLMGSVGAVLMATGAVAVGTGRLAGNPKPNPAGLAPALVAAAVTAAPVQGQANQDDEAARSQSINNLKQFGLAMHNYAGSHGDAFPAAAIRKDGKALLSWRVAILPYLDQGELYKKFHLDEPWDSPHNLALLDQMPDIYAPVTHQEESKHSTYYQVFTGRGALFGGAERTKRADINDGMAWTIMIVEAAKPVPWTKPEDLTFDASKPLPKLGGLFEDGFCACFADGSVRFLKRNVGSNVLKALITVNGREKVSSDEF
jgi:hypothetical protein